MNEFLALENTDSIQFLIIPYERTPIISYKSMCDDIYTNEHDIIRINQKLIHFKGKKILQIHDIHEYTFDGGYNALYQYCKDVKIDAIISNYSDNCEFDTIKEQLNIPIFIYPNTIDDNIWRDYKQDKIYDILIYGNDNAPCYSFRKRMKELLKKQSNHWKIRIIQFNELCGKELAKEINRSYLTIATCSSYNYFLFKYSEIVLSNSYLVGDMSTQGEEYFKEGSYLHIHETMHDDENIELIDNVLKRKDSLAEKCKNQAAQLEYLKRKYGKYYLHSIFKFFL